MRSVRTALLVIMLILQAGCSPQERGELDGFRSTELNGGELAYLLGMKCCKYTYEGPDRWCYWRISAKLYGPDDSLLTDTYLGGGGAGLTKGRSFICSIPVFKGGNAAIRFYGLNTDTEIDPLLPPRESISSWGWNSTLRFTEDEPMILGVFAVNTKYTMSFPNYTIPKKHEGHVLVVQLDLKQGSVEDPDPWPIKAQK